MNPITCIEKINSKIFWLTSNDYHNTQELKKGIFCIYLNTPELPQKK